VPVGQDQKQHVEVTRDIAVKFNTTYGEAFTLPEPEIAESVAVVPGLDGQKMSKSYDNVLEIFAPEKTLRKKIMGIVTDSTPVEAPKDPAGSTLYQLYRLFVDDTRVREMAERFTKGGYGYGEVKKALFGAVWEYFAPYRAKRAEIAADPGIIRDVRMRGAEKARAIAASTMAAVRKLVGVTA